MSTAITVSNEMPASVVKPEDEALTEGDREIEQARKSRDASLRFQGWVVVAGAAVVASAAVSFWPLLTALHADWTTSGLYSHGYIVLAMAVWLAGIAWRAEPPARLAPDWRFVVPLALAMLLVVALQYLLLNTPRLYVLPPLVVACVGLLLGAAAAAKVAWPAALIYFALPLWEVLHGSLQWLTTVAVSQAMAWSGVPVFIEGNFVHLAVGTFEIAVDCSGLKYLLVSASLGYFCALAFLAGWRERFALIGAAVALSVLSNWVRVYTIILAGHLTDMQHYLVAVDHIGFGWAVYVVFLLPLVWLVRRLERGPEARGSQSRPAAAQRIDGPRIAAASLVAALLLSLPALTAAPSSPARDSLAEPLAATVAVPPWGPVFVNARQSWHVDRSAVPAVDVYRAVYERQDAERRLIRYTNRFVGEGWRGITRSARTTALGGEPLSVLELEGYAGAERRVVWAWYQVAGRSATGPVEAKLLELRGLLEGRRDAAAIAISAPCALDCEAARKRLARFLETSADSLK